MGSACCTSDGGASNLAKSRLDEQFGTGTSAACQRIAELLLRVELKIHGAQTLSHPFIVNLGMVLKQATKDGRYAEPFTSGPAFDDARVLRKAARYARYSAAAYLADKRAIADHIGGLQTDNIKYVHKAPLALCPGYFVTIDPDSDDIVLCICGAGSAAEALSYTVSSKEQLLGGRAHTAILESAKLVVDSVLKSIMRLSQESPRRGIAIVGHSVGGATAALVTILLSADGCPFSKLMSNGKVKCYAFGPPPTYAPLWALPSWVHGSIYSFVYNMDCVPRACVGTVSKLYLALKQVDELPLTLDERLQYLRGETGMEHNLPDSAEAPQELSARLGSLFAVGTVVALYRGPDGLMRCEAASPHMLDRLLLHPNMVHDHAIECYEKAFEDLRSDWRGRDGCVVT